MTLPPEAFKKQQLGREGWKLCLQEAGPPLGL